MEKMTRVNALDVAINSVSDSEVVEVLKSIKASIEKANSYKSDKPTKTQLENEKMAMHIYDTMSVNENYTVSEIIKGCLWLRNEDNTPFTTQKVTPMMRNLFEKGLVTSAVIKHKTVYRKVELAE